MKYSLFFLIVLYNGMVFSQSSDAKLPYYEIPEPSEEFTAGTVAARVIDGLGFRYYWATEGLTEQDLLYRPNNEARATAETIDHIFSLSNVIVNATLNKPNVSGGEETELTFLEKRERTLHNFKMAADILRLSDDISQFKTVFKSEKGESVSAFWNQINGPIEDAIWHCGQIVLLRRASGNPFNSNVNLFTGKVRQ